MKKLVIGLFIVGLFGCKKEVPIKAYDCEIIVQGFRSDIGWYKKGFYKDEFNQDVEQVDKMVFYTGDTSELACFGKSSVRLIVSGKEVMNLKRGYREFIFN